MAATIDHSVGLTVTARRLLFRGSFMMGNGFRDYDVTPDDNQFVMLSGGTGRSTLIGVQHFFENLVREQQAKR